MAIVTIVVAIILLIAANALYVAGEFAAVAVSPARIRALAEEGQASARRLQPIVENPRNLDRYIAGCQIGITLSSLLLGAYGEQALAPVLARAFGSLGGWETAAAHSAAFAIVLVGLSVAQMVLGELVPKALALQYADRTATLTTRPISASMRLFAPLIWVFNGSGLAVLRLIGVEPSTERHVHSPAELDLMLSEDTEGGDLDPEERLRLRRALQLSRRRARDLMVPRHQIVGVEIGTSIDEAARRGSTYPYTRFPVYRGDLDSAAGVLHLKDVVRARARGTPAALTDLLRPIISVRPDASAEDLLVGMRRRRASQALVVDARGHTIGLITLGDVLADVFGALADEFKATPARRGRPR